MPVITVTIPVSAHDATARLRQLLVWLEAQGVERSLIEVSDDALFAGLVCGGRRVRAELETKGFRIGA